MMVSGPARCHGAWRLTAAAFLLALTLLACCPAPTAAAGRETSFAATVVSVSDGQFLVQMQSGRQLALSLPRGLTEELPAVGSTVYIVGEMDGDEVLVREINVIGSPLAGG